MPFINAIPTLNPSPLDNDKTVHDDVPSQVRLRPEARATPFGKTDISGPPKSSTPAKRSTLMSLLNDPPVDDKDDGFQLPFQSRNSPTIARNVGFSEVTKAHSTRHDNVRERYDDASLHGPLSPYTNCPTAKMLLKDPWIRSAFFPAHWVCIREALEVYPRARYDIQHLRTQASSHLQAAQGKVLRAIIDRYVTFLTILLYTVFG